MGINFGSVPKPTMKVSTITAAAGDEALRRQKVFEHCRQSVEHLLPSLFFISTSKDHHMDKRQ